MAKAEVQLPEGLLTRLSQLGAKSDEIAEKMLKAGGEVLLSRVKSNLAGVVVPMTDTFALHADNSPSGETQEARISIYTQGSYTKAKNAVVIALLRDDFTITGRQYIGYETSTGYHHYNVDVAKYYELEE